MSEWFKLTKEKFSEKDQEQQWTYSCLFPFTFKKWIITEITITDHTWQKPGRETITKELILGLLREKINGRKRIKPEPKKNPDWPNVFVRKRIFYQGKRYKLVFWFKKGTDNHLWIKNCHQQD